MKAFPVQEVFAIKFDNLDIVKFLISLSIILLLFGMSLYHLQIGIQQMQPNRIVMISPDLYVNEESMLEINILDGHGEFVKSREDTIDISIKAQDEYLIGINDKSEVKWAQMHRVKLRDGAFKIRFKANTGANMGLIVFTIEQVNGETPLQKATFIKNVGYKYGENFFLD